MARPSLIPIAESGSNEPWAAHVVRNRKWSKWTTRQMDHQAVQVHLACYDEAASETASASQCWAFTGSTGSSASCWQ